MATILVVDDHADNRYYLTRLLAHGGYRSLEAADGEEALQIAHTEHPDLIITDILMPKMDGYEFVHRLRQDRFCAETPVIFCSAAYEDEEVRPLAQACGVSIFLRKPAMPEAVFEIVATALGPAAHPPNTFTPSEEFDREHARVLLDKLSQKVDQLEASNRRLVTLIELGRQLTVSQEVSALLGRFCQGARRIIGAEYAAVRILGDDPRSPCHFLFSGIDANAAAKVKPLTPDSGLFARLLTADQPLRGRTATGPETGLSSPPSWPIAQSFLGVAIRFEGVVHGFLYLTNKLDAEEFSEEDEGVVAMLASEIAVAYENARRLETLHEELAERRRAEEHVRKLNAELEQRIEERTADLTRSNQELEQFAYVASHDLQEPLRKIASFSQLLADLYRGQLSAEADEFIGYITDGVERMRSMILDLLAYSRAGRKPIAQSPTDCEGVFAGALSNLQIAMEEAGAVVTHDPLPTVFADQSALIQLFQNLIGNAIKYHGPEPPRVHVAASHRAKEWVFSIQDNGIGIDAQFFDRIFLIFQRLHTREEYPGTGIGLAICKKIVERHGGRIWVESQPGHGAMFFFTLPDECNLPKERAAP